MYTDFSDLAPSSRIWVFQTSRIITPNEQEHMLPLVQSFLDSWTAHQVALKASVKLMHGVLLVIGVDENVSGASGCSIDKLHHFILSLEKMFQLQFMDRFRVIYREDQEVKNISLKQFEEEVKAGKINASQKVFNPMIEKVADLESFEVPISQTWLNRYY